MNEIASIALGALVLLLTLPGTLELAFLTLGAALFRREIPLRTASDPEARMAVIVPAHNEEHQIGACLASLQACDPPAVRTDLVVLADNCSDATAARARAMGVEVLVRDEPLRPGKGPALTFAFERLLARGFDAIVVVDADSRVERNFLVAMTGRLAKGTPAVQCRYVIAGPDAGSTTHLREVAALAMNVLRPRGRAFWGLSAGVLGNGFGLTSATLERVPFRAEGLTEDLEYHVDLVRAGVRVRFVDDTTVWSDAPTGRAAARRQKARWEGGRLRLMVRVAPTLLLQSARGRPRLLEPGLDLLLLPLTFHGIALLFALIVSVGWSRLYAALGLLIVGLHVLLAASLSQTRGRALAALAVGPLHAIWKLSMFRDILRHSRHDAPWVRTPRGNDEH
jgi:cellulose synthase/poly-beta-1,6-N-acetylglucosamine synthase-like glycosyltransferase